MSFFCSTKIQNEGLEDFKCAIVQKCDLMNGKHQILTFGPCTEF